MEITVMNSENIPPFSDIEIFNSLTDKDQTTEMIGFVDEVHAAKTVGTNQQFKLFKFVISNDSKNKIACCIWGEKLIDKYEKEIKLNRILHISGALTKKVKSNYFKESDGFVPFELTIMESTDIAYYGFYKQQSDVTTTPVVAKQIDFKSISDCENNCFVSITGYLKQTIRCIESRYGNMSYGSSAITDGNVKLNLVITNFLEVKIDIGTKVTVTGELSDNDGLITITCKNMSAIKPDNEANKMDIAILMKANKFPKRKAKE